MRDGRGMWWRELCLFYAVCFVHEILWLMLGV